MSRVLTGCLWLLLACPGEDTDSVDQDSDSGEPVRLPMAAITISLLPAGQPNLLVPIQVGVDSTTRRAFVSSNGLPTLGEVDLDSGALVAVHALGNIPSLHPLVAPADDGGVWLGFDAEPAVQRFVAGEWITAAVTPLVQCHALVALPGGAVAAAGRNAEGEDDRLVIVSPDDTVLEVPFSGAVMAMVVTAAGLAVLRADGAQAAEVLTLDPATGEQLDSCGAPDSGIAGGFAWMAALDDGGFGFARSSMVGRVSCPKGEWLSAPFGRENRSVLPARDGGFVVLDRLGGTDRNWGLATTFDSALEVVGRPFETGKNSGYGALDPVTGLAWVNSEGTGELWALNTLTGAVAHRVELGAHVESLAVDPRNADRVVYTGRLTTELGVADLRAGTVQRVDTDRRWAVSPTWLRERLFYLDDLTGEIVEVNADTLVERAVLPSVLGANSFLTLSDLLAHPDRGTLFVTDAQTNELAEVDPDSGALLGRWQLGGVLPEDPDEPGRLELVLAAGNVVSVRNNDGVVTVVNPDSAALAGLGQAHAGAVKLTVRSHQMDAVEPSGSGEAVWLSSGRISLASLVGEVPLEGVDHVLVDEEDGTRLVWRADTAVVEWLVNGVSAGSAEVPKAQWGAPALAYGGSGESAGVALGTFDGAELRWVPLVGAL